MELKTDIQEKDEKREGEFFKLLSELNLKKEEVRAIYTKVILWDPIDERNSDLALKIKKEIFDNWICVNKILWIFDKYYWWDKELSFDDMLAEIMGNRGIFLKL